MSLSQIYDLNSSTLWLGRKLEKGTRSIAIRVNDWIGCGLPSDGRFVLEVCRPTETQQYSYNPAIEFDGEKVIWLITAVDTSIAGQGQCVLRYYVGEDDLIKSKIFKTIVEDSMLPDAGEDPPSALVPFVERIEQAAVDAQNAADEARESATAAGESESNAQQYSTEAREYAESAEGSKNISEEKAGIATDAANAAISAKDRSVQAEQNARLSEENSRQSELVSVQKASEAEQSANSAYADAQRAEQAAAQSGYMWFYIENGRLYMDKTPNTKVDFYMQDGKLYVEEVA